MSEQHPRPEHWWESSNGDGWTDEGPDFPDDTLSSAMSDPISRYAISVPRIPRQRTGEPPLPLRVPTLPPEAVEPTFTQLIPRQYRPRSLDLRDTLADRTRRSELEVRTYPTPVDGVAIVPGAPAPEVTAEPEPADVVEKHASLHLFRGTAKVARKAARALKGLRKAA